MNCQRKSAIGLYNYAGLLISRTFRGVALKLDLARKASVCLTQAVKFGSISKMILIMFSLGGLGFHGLFTFLLF